VKSRKGRKKEEGTKKKGDGIHASGIVKIDNHLKEFVRRTPQVQDVLACFPCR
jgi:hypothetical protein